MSMLEVHPEIHATERRLRPDYSTYFEWQRSFRAKSAYQYSVQLCNSCFDVARHLEEPVVSVHVKPVLAKPSSSEQTSSAGRFARYAYFSLGFSIRSRP
jgi:hypothetical protein